MKPEPAPAQIFTRREFLRLSAGSLALAAFGGLGGCESDLPLKVAAQAVWPGYALMFMAQKQGWLSERDVAFNNTANLGESSAMLSSGKADAAAITLDEVLHIESMGIPLNVIAILDVSAGGDAVLARSEIKSLADLKGKSIGVEKSSLGAIMLAKLLETAGLRREDLRIVPMDYDHLKSVEQNHLDALITYEPTPTLLADRGFTSLLDTRSMPNLIVDVLAVRADRAGRHAAALHKLVDGHFRALELWQTNPVDAGHRLAPILGIPPDQVKNSFHGLNLPDISYNHHYLTAPAEEMVRSAKEISAILIQEGQTKTGRPPEQIFSADYLPEVN